MHRKFCSVSLFLLCLAPFAGHSEESSEAASVEEEKPEPWFSGTLIAPRGTAISLGHFEIDSYLYFTTYSGIYNGDWKSSNTPNFYSLNPQWLCYFGLTPWMDITIVPQFLYNATQGQSDIGFGDFSAGLDIQLYPDDAHSWFPGIKLGLKETFPTGKYDHLAASKLGTDAMGVGAFAASLDLVFYKVYPIHGSHFLTVNISGTYIIPSTVNVDGFNVYGGGLGTHGKVSGGNSLTAICSFEYNLTQNWALALDNVWIHTDSSPFSGEAGLAASGDIATVGTPSSEQLSFAPALEYNFNENLGMIGGCWFTAIGRNTDVFQSAAIEFYCYY